jgi:hypothetical protein
LRFAAFAYFSTLKKKAVSSSETSINFYQTAWSNLPRLGECRIRIFFTISVFGSNVLMYVNVLMRVFENRMLRRIFGPK